MFVLNQKLKGKSIRDWDLLLKVVYPFVSHNDIM